MRLRKLRIHSWVLTILDAKGFFSLPRVGSHALRILTSTLVVSLRREKKMATTLTEMKHARRQSVRQGTIVFSSLLLSAPSATSLGLIIH